ncbi:MAG: hypothetical protein NZ898_02625 [Myxococcota bacterium]|nr:hypothetical protein [Myxococcota bacterium]MDW8361267.1 hypothetical protein [Myxococcales bacterium]
MRVVVGCIGTWLVLAGNPARSAAQSEPSGVPSEADAEARRAFVEGRDAYAAGRYELALERFQRAYELSGRAALLYNIGLAHDRLRHDREALEAYRRFLEAEPDSAVRAEVEARVRVLERELEREQRIEARLRQQPAAVSSEPSSHGLLSSPWFWAAVGVLVAGGAVALTVALTRDPGQADPRPGPSGHIVMVLRAPP